MKDNEFLKDRYADLFTEEEVAEPALSTLLSDLETIYSSGKRPASIESQLSSALLQAMDPREPATKKPLSSSEPEQLLRRNTKRPQKTWIRTASTLAAVLIVGVIVGSLLLVLHQAHQGSHSGSNIQKKSTAPFDRFWSVHMFTTTTGWAQISDSNISSKFAILHTTDGGIHWQNTTPTLMAGPVADNLQKLYAIDASTAVVTDVFSQNPSQKNVQLVALRTTDAGRTWERFAIPPSMITDGFIADMHFLNRKIGWITVSNTVESNDGKTLARLQNDVWQTNDGGQTWKHMMSINVMHQSGYITFIDEKHWYMDNLDFQHGRPVISFTTDGGSTWHTQELPVPAGISCRDQTLINLMKMQFFSSQEGVLLVECDKLVMYVTHDSGSTWTPTTPVDTITKNGYSIRGITFADVNHGWIYGDVIPLAGQKLPTTNRIIMTSDGGKHWVTKEVRMPGARQGQTVSLDGDTPNPIFVTAKVGWLFGYYSPLTSTIQSNVLFKTTDGGLSWQIIHYHIS